MRGRILILAAVAAVATALSGAATAPGGITTITCGDVLPNLGSALGEGRLIVTPQGDVRWTCHAVLDAAVAQTLQIDTERCHVVVQTSGRVMMTCRSSS